MLRQNREYNRGFSNKFFNGIGRVLPVARYC